MRNPYVAVEIRRFVCTIFFLSTKLSTDAVENLNRVA